MILPLLALATAVQAADLHVKITPPGGEPVAIDYPDVKVGALPGFTVLAFDGAELIVHITLFVPGEPSPGATSTIGFDVVIQELAADKKGRAWLKVLSNPRIMTMVNQPGSLTTGARIPIEGTDPVEYEECGLSIELLYADPTVPDPESTAPAVDNPETPR